MGTGETSPPEAVRLKPEQYLVRAASGAHVAERTHWFASGTLGVQLHVDRDGIEIGILVT